MERWGDLLTANLLFGISMIIVLCEATIFATIILETPCYEFVSMVHRGACIMRT